MTTRPYVVTTGRVYPLVTVASTGALRATTTEQVGDGQQALIALNQTDVYRFRFTTAGGPFTDDDHTTIVPTDDGSAMTAWIATTTDYVGYMIFNVGLSAPGLTVEPFPGIGTDTSRALSFVGATGQDAGPSDPTNSGGDIYVVGGNIGPNGTGGAFRGSVGMLGNQVYLNTDGPLGISLDTTMFGTPAPIYITGQQLQVQTPYGVINMTAKGVFSFGHFTADTGVSPVDDQWAGQDAAPGDATDGGNVIIAGGQKGLPNHYDGFVGFEQGDPENSTGFFLTHGTRFLSGSDGEFLRIFRFGNSGDVGAGFVLNSVSTIFSAKVGGVSWGLPHFSQEILQFVGFNSASQPSTPSTGMRMYVDTGAFKFYDQSGLVGTVASTSAYRKEALLATTNNTPTPVVFVSLPNNCAVDVEWTAVGINTGSPAACYIVKKLLRGSVVAGTATILTEDVIGTTHAGIGASSATSFAFGAAFGIQVAGIAATNINWTVTADVKVTT